MPKNCNRNCLDHKEHVISRSHTPLDVKPKANCWKKKKCFPELRLWSRKGTQRTADNLQGAPANMSLMGFTILLFSVPMHGKTCQRLLLLATSLLHSHAKISGFASQRCCCCFGGCESSCSSHARRTIKKQHLVYAD